MLAQNEGPRIPRSNFPNTVHAVDVQWFGVESRSQARVENDERLRVVFTKEVEDLIGPFMVAGGLIPPESVATVIRSYLERLGASSEVEVASSDPDQIILDVVVESYPRGLRIVLERGLPS